MNPNFRRMKNSLLEKLVAAHDEISNEKIKNCQAEVENCKAQTEVENCKCQIEIETEAPLETSSTYAENEIGSD